MTAALRCFLLALFALASIHDTRSQTLVYPVRSGHKWGYINLRGKWMIRPRYEAFSETDLPWNIHPESNKLAPSPYRLVESDGKVGLTDRTLREVLPCQYKRIRPISRHWFAV
ncbi:MAG TPA: WG repeat-containing protein, partial [Saprospiraceae bacterium]|nr:WG repeat-containing protein [Saprospiraceae bacterium]